MTTRLKNRQKKGADFGRAKMDTQTEAWFLSVLQTEDTHSTPPTLTLSELEKWSVFTSIDDLPFPRYVDCACSGDYSRLCYGKGRPTKTVLMFAWQNIQQEFNEAIGGAAMERATTLKCEIEMLSLNIQRVTILLDAIETYGPHADLVHQIREEGFDRPFSAESYRDDVRIVRENAKIHEHKRNEKIAEAEVLMPVQTEGERELPTRATYTKCLVQISKQSKFHIDINKLTTREFCIYYRDLIDHAESHKTRTTQTEDMEA